MSHQRRHFCTALFGRRTALFIIAAIFIAGCSKKGPNKPPQPMKKNSAKIEEANQLFTRIGKETSEQYTPVFLYESPTYRRVTEDICGFKELFFVAAEEGLLDDAEFFVAWQAMEHLPLTPYIKWMTIWVDNFKQGQADYRKLKKILFPNMDENSEYYYHFKEAALSTFYRNLKNDTEFKAALKNDNSLARYGDSAANSFRTQVDNFLAGKEWEKAKEEIAACQIIPSHAPRDQDCPATTVREKEKPPKWWKVKCDADFGETPGPDTYWSGPGGEAPWW